jgi:hypothetical protein
MVFELGWFGLIAPVLILTSLKIQKKMNLLSYKHDTQRRQFSDQRAAKIDEVIVGAKNIKFNAWELLLNLKIMDIRNKEKRKIFITSVIRGLSWTMMKIVPNLSAVICFSLYNTYKG